MKIHNDQTKHFADVCKDVSETKRAFEAVKAKLAETTGERYRRRPLAESQNKLLSRVLQGHAGATTLLPRFISIPIHSAKIPFGIGYPAVLSFTTASRIKHLFDSEMHQKLVNDTDFN